VDDKWVWKLHSSHNYMVKSAYNYLTAIGVVPNEVYNHLLWLKAVPLKVTIFVLRLFLNRLVVNDNLCRRRVLDVSQISCSAVCGGLEDRDHLFFMCDFYGRLWLLKSGWLGISTVLHGNILAHSTHFGGLGSYSKNSPTTFNIISILVLFIIWKDCNKRIFPQ